MTPLRQPFIEDMKIRNLAVSTQQTYVGYVANFARYFGKSPEELEPEEIRRYQLYLVERRGYCANSLMVATSALKLFYRATVPREWAVEQIALPKQLRALALQNRKVVCDILFRTASQTLLTIGADPKHLGANLGFMAILHTWGQTLVHHPHLHCLVPGGGLAPGGQRWIACRTRYFLPAPVLAMLFRRLFLQALLKAFHLDQLNFHGNLAPLATAEAFGKLLKQCRGRQWNLYIQPPFAAPETVLDYSARYTHRIAISNYRLLAMKDSKVTFSYRDYKAGGVKKTIPLDAHPFIRRFLRHVLPNGFQRIRYYGFMANRHRAQKLELCRRLLRVPTPSEASAPQEEDRSALIQALTRIDPFLCPSCEQGHLVRLGLLQPSPPFHRPLPSRGRPP